MTNFDNTSNDLKDDIIDLIDETFDNISDEYGLLKIINEIDNNKWQIKVLLWWNYKNNTSEPNRISIEKTNNQIILNEIVTQWLWDIYIFVLLKYAIDNNIVFKWKAEPFLDLNNYSQKLIERRQKILRNYYEKFLLKKDLDKNSRNHLVFDFENLSFNDLKIFYNRLKKFNMTNKWSR